MVSAQYSWISGTMDCPFPLWEGVRGLGLTLPLDGVRVIELATLHLGPGAGAILADWART